MYCKRSAVLRPPAEKEKGHPIGCPFCFGSPICLPLTREVLSATKRRERLPTTTRNDKSSRTAAAWAQPCPLVCHSVIRLADSATGSARLLPRLTVTPRGGLPLVVGQGQQGEKRQKEKAGQMTCSSFWLSLLDLNQRPYGMTNRRVLRHAKASLVRSCVILSSPETAYPLSLRDIPLTGGHPSRCICHWQRSTPSQINSPASANVHT